MSERYEMLEETLQIAHQKWTGDQVPFQGKHFRLQRPLNSPEPISRPHPPILVGGNGEKKTLRLVARSADACDLFEGVDVRHKVGGLRQHCQDAGRDYHAIEKTLHFRVSEGDDADRTVER